MFLYADGAADIEYKVDVDPTLARVNITLFGDTFEDFIAKDQEDTLLDYITTGDTRRSMYWDPYPWKLIIRLTI